MRLLKIIPFILFCLFISNSIKSVEIEDLRCENLKNPLAIDNRSPHFSWKLTSKENGTRQIAYQIIVASDSVTLAKKSKGDIWDSGKVDSDASVMVPYGGNRLSPSSLYYWKVRVWDEKGEASSWSSVASFGVGLLDAKGWAGEYVGLTLDGKAVNSPILWKEINIDNKQGKYLFHVNSLGYHEVYINGKKVNEDVLSPAVSQLDKRSLSVTYDVTNLLEKGKNDIVLWLSQGWYKSNLYKVAHEGPIVRAQLNQLKKKENRVLVVTDGSWKGTESGYEGIGNWNPHQFGGEKIDARRVFASLDADEIRKHTWSPVIEVVNTEHKVSPQMCEPNQIQKTVYTKDVKRLNDTTWIVDMGKNLTGWAKIKFPILNEGQEILMEYADHLETDGVFPTLLGHKDIYIASGKGEEVFCNRFNYHAFRYIRISNLPQEIKKEDILGYLIYPTFDQASSFQSSDADLNAIHDMIQYTFRCLTLGGYTVDCPHIERLGYGGDGNTSAQTLQTMYNVSPLLYNWMQSWEDCMRSDGSLPHTAPSPTKAGGGPSWCAFIIYSSWKTYVNNNDKRLIERYYPFMQRWLGYVDKYSVGGLLKKWENTDYRHWYLGDWLPPKGINPQEEASVDIVNNSFISECLDYMSKIATILNKEEDARLYAEKRDALNAKIHETFYNPQEKTYATASQIDMMIPMLVGATPQSIKKDVKEKLFLDAQNKYKGHIATGLVGVNTLTDWAVREKAVDFVYSMLKKRDYPGYLYMIDQGATTTWEEWGGDRSHIHNCYNGIGAWFYQAVGGIRIDENLPGYKHILIEPQVPEGVTWAKTEKETPYGLVSVNWKLDGSEMMMDVTLPVGCTASVALPDNITKYRINSKDKDKKDSTVKIESGKYAISYAFAK